jgi:hypothetical protein
MDITEVWIDALYSLTVQYRLKAEHTVGSRVLRTDVNDVVVWSEESVLLRLQVAILIKIVLQAIVRLYVILKGVFVIELPVLAERITIKVATQEQATHIRMTQEYDAIEIINLALQQISYTPDIGNGWEICQHLTFQIAATVARHAIAANLLLGNLLYGATLVGRRILKNIDTAKAFFLTKVLANDRNKIVKALLVLQVLHL